MEFELKIKCGSAEMEYGAHIAEALRKVADTMEYNGNAYHTVTPCWFSIQDSNGNTVGEYGVRPEKRKLLI